MYGCGTDRRSESHACSDGRARSGAAGAVATKDHARVNELGSSLGQIPLLNGLLWSGHLTTAQYIKAAFADIKYPNAHPEANSALKKVANRMRMAERILIPVIAALKLSTDIADRFPENTIASS